MDVDCLGFVKVCEMGGIVFKVEDDGPVGLGGGCDAGYCGEIWEKTGGGPCEHSTITQVNADGDGGGSVAVYVAGNKAAGFGCKYPKVTKGLKVESIVRNSAGKDRVKGTEKRSDGNWRGSECAHSPTKEQNSNGHMTCHMRPVRFHLLLQLSMQHSQPSKDFKIPTSRHHSSRTQAK